MGSKEVACYVENNRVLVGCTSTRWCLLYRLQPQDFQQPRVCCPPGPVREPGLRICVPADTHVYNSYELRQGMGSWIQVTCWIDKISTLEGEPSIWPGMNTESSTEIQNYLLPYGHDPYGSQSTGNGSHHWCFYLWEILRHIPWMQVVSSRWVPFEFWWVYDVGRRSFGICASKM